MCSLYQEYNLTSDQVEAVAKVMVDGKVNEMKITEARIFDDRREYEIEISFPSATS